MQEIYGLKVNEEFIINGLVFSNPFRFNLGGYLEEKRGGIWLVCNNCMAYQCYIEYGITRKSNPIVAIQWTGLNLKEVIDLIGMHPSVLHWTWEMYEKVVMESGLKIFTPDGPIIAKIGDYILKHANGSCYIATRNIEIPIYIRNGDRNANI